LLKGINFNKQIGNNGSIEDVFGRNHFLSTQNNVKKPLDEEYAWEKSYFLDPIDSYKKLYDIFENMFSLLGKRIVLNDPYCFGITSIINNEIQGNESHTYFLNALRLSIAKFGIEEIILIGRWEKSKKDFYNSKNIENKDRLYELYNFVSNELKIKKSSFDSLKSFKIAFPNENFHDRFWAGLNADNTIKKIFHVSSSVSSYFENGELLIYPLNGSIFNKISLKLQRRLNCEAIKDVIDKDK
jgi:hypothetical protein